jgi:cell division protein FtsA
LSGLDKLASDYFDLPSRIGYPMHVGGLTETIKNPAYATAVGLVLFGAAGDGAKPERTNGRGTWSRVATWVGQVFRL